MFVPVTQLVPSLEQPSTLFLQVHTVTGHFDHGSADGDSPSTLWADGNEAGTSDTAHGWSQETEALASLVFGSDISRFTVDQNETCSFRLGLKSVAANVLHGVS